ncbi:MAG TPA: serine hydrolase domain-containing protein [Labilithrix sp.]|nr:serine hydrolase domain-containing protein [Labilithrix sp.]
MRLSLLALLLAVSATACNHAKTAPAAGPTGKSSVPTAAVVKPEPTSRRLDSETILHTVSGASLRGAVGWTVTEGIDPLVLVAPEGGVTLTLAEIEEADADKAIARAWKAKSPSFALPERRRTTPPARDGWEAVTQIEYETPAAEHRVVVALARKLGSRQHVALVEGTEASIDRRGAQLMTAVTSYKPKGLDEETLAGRSARKLDDARLSELLDFAERARQTARIPGVAIGIVQDGKVVLTRGLGLRELGKRDLVGPKTLFMIGSTTKSLTTMMMAKLVDEGVFGWDTPVRIVEPTFSLGDADASKKITMRHTVCACTGLPREDLAFFFEYRDATPETHMKRLAHMKPTTAFGETFQYSNTLVAAGGFVAAHAAMPKVKLGPAYDTVLRSRVLEPLGMRASTSDMNAARRADHAIPHVLDAVPAARPTALSTEEGVVPVRPAGALWSNAEDMTRVLLVELGKGMLDGKRLFSEANLLERRKPQAKIFDKLSYGLGLMVGEDHGVPVIEHGGNNVGFTSDMFFLPEHGLGMVVLTNLGDAGPYRRALRRKLIEIVFDAKPEAEENLRHRVEDFDKRLAEQKALVAKAPSKELLSSVVGAWSNPELGRIDVRATKDGAILDAGEWKSAFSEKVEKDGARKLYLLEPPFYGLEADVVNDEKGTTLVVGSGQERHTFTRLR